MRGILARVLVLAAVSAAPALDGTGLDSLLRHRTPWNPRPLPGDGFERPALPGLRRTAATVRSWPPDSVIRDDFVCNDDVTGGCRQVSPRVGVAGDGSFVVAWYGFTAGETDIWYQRFDPAGRPLGENRAANDDSMLRWQGNAAVAVRQDGSYLLTWEDRWRLGDSDIFAQLFDAGGNALGRNFRVSDSGVPGDQMVNWVWTAQSGLTLAAWDDRRHGLTGDIFAQFLDSLGRPLDGNFIVNDDGINIGNQYRPRVGGDDAGRAVVVWMDGRTGTWNVYGQRFGPDRARLGRNFAVTYHSRNQWSPGLGVSPSGRFLVCWEDQRRDQWDIYARVYDSAGQPVDESFRVNDDPDTAEQSDCAAAGNGYDEFLVVWTDRRSGWSEILGQRYGQDGSPLGANFPVSTTGSAPAGRSSPAAAARPDGGYIVAWSDGKDGHLDIYARLLARDGTPEGPPFRVNTDLASSLQRVSSLGMYADGRVLVAWEDERNGQTDIYSVLLGPDGQPTGRNLRLSDDAPGVSPQYYAAVAAGRARALVTWSDGRGGGRFSIFGQYLDSLGRPLGDNFLVNSPDSGHRWYSYTAMDDSNRAVVTWSDTRTGKSRIYVRRFGADGRPAGDDSPVGDTDASQYYASVAAGRAGRFLVSWMDYRDGDRPRIYCQLFDTCGTRLGPNFRADNDPGSNYKGYPVAAIADDGSFVVAWEDRRNETYDVYMQWFDPDRNPLGANARVNDGPVGPYAYSPSCAFDRQGRLALLFNDEREHNRSPGIYVQRFRPDRTRISRNQKISRPKDRPRDHHWTVGQSIAVSDSVVAVTWTGNRRLQGWDIYAKFTDWDLVGVAEPGTPGRAPAAIPFRVAPSVAPGGRFTVFSPPGELRLYDAGGRFIRSIDAQPRQTEVDLGDLPAGVYLLAPADRGQTPRLKLVIPDRR